MSEKIMLYHELFLLFFIAAFLCFVAAMGLFFLLKIQSVIEYLTGRTAKKQIKALELAAAKSKSVQRGEFVIVKDVMIIHTEEVIGKEERK